MALLLQWREVLSRIFTGFVSISFSSANFTAMNMETIQEYICIDVYSVIYIVYTYIYSTFPSFPANSKTVHKAIQISLLSIAILMPHEGGRQPIQVSTSIGLRLLRCH